MAFKYVPLRSRAPDTGLVPEGREEANLKHVVRNFFHLKLVALLQTDSTLIAQLMRQRA
jgi:hypothetical protein